MLQKLETPLDRIAQIPASRALEKARAVLEEARQAEEVAADAFRHHCRRVAAVDRWVRHDSAARDAESEALRAHAALRLANAEVEAAKRTHGETLVKHLSKHGPDALELLTTAIEEASTLAHRLAAVCDRASADGANVPYSLTKVRRVEVGLRQLRERMS